MLLMTRDTSRDTGVSVCKVHDGCVSEAVVLLYMARLPTKQQASQTA